MVGRDKTLYVRSKYAVRKVIDIEVTLILVSSPIVVV